MQLKIPPATGKTQSASAKTQHSQININTYFLKKEMHVDWKKKLPNLRAENYVLFGRIAEDLSQETTSQILHGTALKG